MNAYYLFLDDQRYPKDVKWIDLPLYNWTIARTYNDFTKIIKQNGLPKAISFDHDLGQESFKSLIKEGVIDYSKYTEKTGYDAAKWLINYCNDKNLPLPSYTVHSMNTVGIQNIKSVLESYNNYKGLSKKYGKLGN